MKAERKLGLEESVSVEFTSKKEDYAWNTLFFVFITLIKF